MMVVMLKWVKTIPKEMELDAMTTEYILMTPSERDLLNIPKRRLFRGPVTGLPENITMEGLTCLKGVWQVVLYEHGKGQPIFKNVRRTMKNGTLIYQYKNYWYRIAPSINKTIVSKPLSEVPLKQVPLKKRVALQNGLPTGIDSIRGAIKNGTKWYIVLKGDTEDNDWVEKPLKRLDNILYYTFNGVNYRAY